MPHTRLNYILIAAALVGLGWFFGALASVDKSATYTLSGTTESVFVPANTRPVDAMSAESTAVIATTTITVPEDGWVTSFSQEFQGAPDQALRYSWVYDASQNDVYCPEIPRVVFVMSFEKVPELAFTPGYGYFAKAGTPLVIVGGFGNFSDADYPAASMTVRLGFAPASRNSLGNAYPFFLNAECTSIFTIPAHTARFVKNLKQPFTIPFDGAITFMGSHAHKHVKEMRVTLNGNELWKTTAIYLPDGSNLGNPVYITPFNGVPVKKGDLLDLSEIYSNPTDKQIDAMASMYFHLIPMEADTASHGQ